ncbi:Diaphanous, partial [Dinochytrium kinnereticum]
LVKVQHVEEVLSCIQFKLSFPERFKSLDEEVTVSLLGFQALKKADHFMEVLELILALGNFMNSGSFMGSVYGFKIGSLNKIADVKGANGKTTLLHYVAEVIETKIPHLKSFVNELKDVSPASRVNPEVLRSDLRQIRKNVTDLTTLLAKLPQTSPFLQVLSSFAQTCTEMVEELEGRFKRMEKMFKEAVKLFGEDDGKMKQDEFFAVFKVFLGGFEAALSDNATEKERQMVIERRKKAQEEREASRKARTQKAMSLSTGIDHRRAMDDIIESLKRGSLIIDAPSILTPPLIKVTIEDAITPSTESLVEKYTLSPPSPRRPADVPPASEEVEDGVVGGFGRVRRAQADRALQMKTRKVSTSAVGAKALELLGRLKEEK